jgi:aryl-alcohol dehydrogenase-like predicted oxidoreductase
MNFNQLGNTDIKVSEICLGTMTYGEQNTIQEAHEQLDYALDQGVNFIDTAEMYPVPPRAETYTKTEEFIGKWEKLKSHRDQIILATKIVGKSEAFKYIRNGSAKLDKFNINEAINNSLKRLNVDYVDLYQLHWPDRPTNYFGQRGYISNDIEFTDFEEILYTLDEIKKAGRVRHFGISNETPWGAMSYLNISKQLSLPRIQSIQNPYSLLNRTYEIGLAEVSYKEKCGLMAYSPLGFGVLSGKYLNNQKPKNSRLSLFQNYSRYSNANATLAVEKYVKLANFHNIDPSQMALAFVNSRPFLTSTVIGATTMDQLKINIESCNLELSSEILEEIELIHANNPNPSP